MEQGDAQLSDSSFERNFETTNGVIKEKIEYAEIASATPVSNICNCALTVKSNTPNSGNGSLDWKAAARKLTFNPNGPPTYTQSKVNREL